MILTWQDIRYYLLLLLRWWPLIIIAMALSGASAWALAKDQPAYYEARTSLMVGNNFQVAAPNNYAVDVSNTVARYYEVLVRRDIILQPVIDQLGLPHSVGSVNQTLATSLNRDANLLEISLGDTDPERAAAVVNAIATQLLTYSPSAPDKIAAEQAEIDRQLNEAQIALNDLKTRIGEFEQRQGQLTAAVELRENQEKLAELERSRERYQETYSQLLVLRNNTSANSLSIFERAEPPKYPVPQKTTLIIAGAGLAGGFLGVVTVLLLDLIDNRWRSGKELQHRLGITHLGSLIKVGGRRHNLNRAQRAQSIFETHSQIILAADGRQPNMLLVSSPNPNEQRSHFAIDLADQYGQAGHRVLLVDAELEKPVIGALLLYEADARPQTSMSDKQPLEPWSGAQAHRNGGIPSELWVRLRPTVLKNVLLLPGRARDDANSSIRVPSLHWPELIEVLRNSVDVIIFDGPSALTSADAALLAPLVDGMVLVLDPKQDTRASVAETRRRLLRNKSSRLLGAVTVGSDNQTPAKPAALKRFPLSIHVDGGGITLMLAPQAVRPKGLLSGPSPEIEDEDDADQVEYRSPQTHQRPLITPMVVVEEPDQAEPRERGRVTMTTSPGRDDRGRRPRVRPAGRPRRAAERSPKLDEHAVGE